jgi:hypothetical protein
MNTYYLDYIYIYIYIYIKLWGRKLVLLENNFFIMVMVLKNKFKKKNQKI